MNKSPTTHQAISTDVAMNKSPTTHQAIPTEVAEHIEMLAQRMGAPSLIEDRRRHLTEMAQKLADEGLLD